MQTSEVLNQAADLIEERGWAKGNCGMDAREVAPLCLEGALGAAAGVRVEHDLMPFPIYSYAAIEKLPAYRVLRDHLECVADLYYWNDRQGDAACVIEVLRACAVIEQAREQRAADERMPEAMPEGVLHP